MGIFKKEGSPHWIEYYKQALECVRSGDLKGANELVHKSLGIDPITLRFSKRKYKKKANENPTIFVKADFFSLVCQGALARLKFDQEFEVKGNVNYDAFHESADWAELISNKIQSSKNIDILLIKDIDESIADDYLKDRPEDPKKRLGYFFKYFHRLAKQVPQERVDIPDNFRETKQAASASLPETMNKEYEQNRRVIITQLLILLNEIRRKKSGRIKVEVDRVTLDTKTNKFVLVLKDEMNNRLLYVVVSKPQAQAIALHLEKIVAPVPLSHDLGINLLKAIKANLKEVVINELRENVYYSYIVLEHNGQYSKIDAGVSDAIALALRAQASIFVCREVMDMISIPKK